MIVFVSLASFLSAKGLTGAVNPLADKIFTIVCLYALVSLVKPDIYNTYFFRHYYKLIYILVIPLFLFIPDSGRPLWVLITLLAMLYFAKGSKHMPLLHNIILTLACGVLIHFLARHVSFIWYVLDLLSITISGLVGLVLRYPLTIGPSLSGLWIFVLCLLFSGFTIFNHSTPPKTKWRLFISYNSIALICLMIYLGLLPLIEDLVLYLITWLLSIPEPHRPYHIKPGVIGSVAQFLLLILNSIILSLFFIDYYKVDKDEY